MGLVPGAASCVGWVVLGVVWGCALFKWVYSVGTTRGSRTPRAQPPPQHPAVLVNQGQQQQKVEPWEGQVRHGWAAQVLVAWSWHCFS
jgi:hypothetical protein